MVALTAWTREDRFDEFDERRVERLFGHFEAPSITLSVDIADNEEKLNSSIRA